MKHAPVLVLPRWTVERTSLGRSAPDGERKTLMRS